MHALYDFWPFHLFVCFISLSVISTINSYTNRIFFYVLLFIYFYIILMILERIPLRCLKPEVRFKPVLKM